VGIKSSISCMLNKAPTTEVHCNFKVGPLGGD
jgi:hypothetical protein